jgi:hydroxymethylglutaryl-CoA lyase
MTNRVRITDVAPRDGLQNEPTPVPIEHKARLVELLAAAGVDEVEVTSFVSPKWVPQLADASELLTQVAGVRRAVQQPPVFSVLAPNEKGFDRALEAHESIMPLKLALFTAASEAFNERNTNATIAESIERFRPIVPRALDAGIPLRFYISTVVACPLSGPVAPANVAHVVDLLRELVPSDDDWRHVDIDLGETLGVATPDDIDRLLDAIDDADVSHCTLHLHDTQGRAADCVRGALQRGVRSFDGSAAGLGGCPYAGTPAQPAPGNIATHTLLEAVSREGFTTGVNRQALDVATAFAATLTERGAASPR